MRIFLVGFMGSGKSRVGKELAEALDYQHIDLDEWIVQKEGRSIPEIFEEQGEAHFRELEHRYLLEMAKEEDTVISSGGGTPCFSDHIHWMNAHGLTIFLDLSEDRLLERLLRKPGKRPLITGKSLAEVQGFIQKKLAERRGFYEQAKILYRIGEEEREVTQGVHRIVQSMLG
ncbi:MAG: shikimate kinase [Bacteroidota bacterium]